MVTISNRRTRKTSREAGRETGWEKLKLRHILVSVYQFTRAYNGTS